MPGNKPRSSYKKKRKDFYGVRPWEGDRKVKTQRTEQSNISTIGVPNEMNSKASEFPISVSRRKLSHEMTQQQDSKRKMIENTLLTGQLPTLLLQLLHPNIVVLVVISCLKYKVSNLQSLAVLSKVTKSYIQTHYLS